MNFSKEFLDKVIDSIRLIDLTEIERMVDILYDLRERKGRLFIIGSGGGAGHASHAACDFRKLCHINAFTLENLTEITARANDEGWENTASSWMKTFNLTTNDCLMVISVGGGTFNVSKNLVNALTHAKCSGLKIIGIVGPNGGETAKLSDARVIINTKSSITPIVEGIQSVLLHLLCEHPSLKEESTVW
jgi:D-sedoheptulose 7-phosphate isomerase